MNIHVLVSNTALFSLSPVLLLTSLSASVVLQGPNLTSLSLMNIMLICSRVLPRVSGNMVSPNTTAISATRPYRKKVPDKVIDCWIKCHVSQEPVL